MRTFLIGLAVFNMSCGGGFLEDADGDGVDQLVDCDDSDPALGSARNDEDCDGEDSWGCEEYNAYLGAMD